MSQARNLANFGLHTTTSAGAVTFLDGATDVDIAQHDTSNGLKLGGTIVTTSAAELNKLDGCTASTTELNLIDGVTSSTAELNILDGVTATATKLNYVNVTPGTATASKATVLDSNLHMNAVKTTGLYLGASGSAVLVSSTSAELNILDGATLAVAELNILDGATVSTAELNKLDGVTATTAKLNYVDVKKYIK